MKVLLICKCLKAVGSLAQKSVGEKRNCDQVRNRILVYHLQYILCLDIVSYFLIKIIFLFEGLSQSCYQIQNLM